MPAELATIRSVPILETGIEYPLMTGPRTFTTDDLAAALGSFDDPSIKTPRLKLGHDGTFDGEPSFGVATNLQLSNEGHTLLADFVGVPQWLAEVMPYAWPSRSIEGMSEYESATGRKHDFVLFAVSLLGVQMPGVSTLDDMAGWFGAAAPEGVTYDFELKGGNGVPPKRIAAEAQVDDLRRAYYDSLTSDQAWWWIRSIYVDPPELIVDDDEGGLYRVSYEVSGNGDITFGDAQPVVIRYVDQKEPAKATVAAAKYASRAEARPNKEAEAVTEFEKAIRERLGLPADATDEQVLEAAQRADDPPQPTPAAPGEQNPNPPATPPTTEPVTEPGADPNVQPPGNQPATAPQEQAGTVTVDRATWDQMTSQVQSLAARAQQDERTRRDGLVTAAMKAGKFPPARKDHYRKLLDVDPTGTEALLASLAPGLIPVDERGGAGESEEHAASSSDYPAHWLPEVAARRERASHRRGRVTQEA